MLYSIVQADFLCLESNRKMGALFLKFSTRQWVTNLYFQY